MLTVRPLTCETYSDARTVVSARFPLEALKVLEQTQRNPLLSSCCEAGDIVYEDGRPVAFRAANRRRLHYKEKPIIGRVRGLTCRLKGSPKCVMDLLQDEQQKKKRGCSLAYSNTQCIPTARMAAKRGAFPGPESCSRFVWRAIRPFECLKYAIQRKIFKSQPRWGVNMGWVKAQYFYSNGGMTIERMISLDNSFFDELMESYLRLNSGLVSDRWAKDIEWLFSERIARGTCVILSAREEGAPVGYIALTTDECAKRWLITDWFSVGNDEVRLRRLLEAGCLFLKEKTPAMMLETIGYPMYVQKLLKEYLPHVRRCNVNWCSYNFIDKDLERECKDSLLSNKSWFFGPYDGDMCMG